MPYGSTTLEPVGAQNTMSTVSNGTGLHTCGGEEEVYKRRGEGKGRGQGGGSGRGGGSGGRGEVKGEGEGEGGCRGEGGGGGEGEWEVEKWRGRGGTSCLEHLLQSVDINGNHKRSK